MPALSHSRSISKNGTSRFGLGNVNPSLYSLLGSTITVHDVTIGNNKLQCTNGTPNCTKNGTNNNYVMTGYAAGTGYDAASGFGSFIINNFVTNYAPSGATASTVTLNVVDATTNQPLPACTINGVTFPHCTTHSTWLKFTVTATPSAATGDVAIFTSSPLQGEQAVESLTLSGGTASDSWNLLPGGSYNIYARYAGNSTYAASVTSSSYPIMVKPEGCQMVVYGHNINTGSSTNIPYGTPVSITVEPYSLASTNNVAIPSGSINVTDGATQITTLPINSEGAATFSSNLLAQGSHSIKLTYPGDASFTSCSTGTYLANITKASTTTTLKPSNASANSGFIYMTAVVQSATFPNNGTAPTGTVTFNTNPSQTVTLVQGFDPNGNAIATASISVSKQNLSSGSLTGTYNPASGSNYTGSSGTVNVDTSDPYFNGTSTTTFTISDTNGITSPGPYPASDSLTLNIHIASNADPSGCGTFFGFPLCSTPLVSVYADGILLTNSLTVDSNGNATFTLPQQNGYLALPSGKVQIDVIYSGYYFLASFIAQNGASSTFQTITISDDRTNADFSLQSDTTVNQSAPLVGTTTQASYNLRLTSLYNFNSAYSTTPIKLTCSVIGYSLAGVRKTIPTGLTCGFGTLTTTTVNATIGTAGYTTNTLVVGADASHSIASNAVPAQPANHWWIATGGTTLACIFLLGLPARRRKWQSLLGACVMVIVSFGMTGCGATVAPGPDQSYYNTVNGGGGTANGTGPAVTAGTYTVLVTATTTTNTTLVHTLPIQVLVGSTN